MKIAAHIALLFFLLFYFVLHTTLINAWNMTLTFLNDLEEGLLHIMLHCLRCVSIHKKVCGLSQNSTQTDRHLFLKGNVHKRDELNHFESDNTRSI